MRFDRAALVSDAGRGQLRGFGCVPLGPACALRVVVRLRPVARRGAAAAARSQTSTMCRSHCRASRHHGSGSASINPARLDPRPGPAASSSSKPGYASRCVSGTTSVRRPPSTASRTRVSSKPTTVTVCGPRNTTRSPTPQRPPAEAALTGITDRHQRPSPSNGTARSVRTSVLPTAGGTVPAASAIGSPATPPPPSTAPAYANTSTRARATSAAGTADADSRPANAGSPASTGSGPLTSRNSPADLRRRPAPWPRTPPRHCGSIRVSRRGHRSPRPCRRPSRAKKSGACAAPRLPSGQNSQNGCDAMPTTAGSKSSTADVIALEPGLVTHMVAGCGRPPQARVVALTPKRRKRPHLRHQLERRPGHHRQRRPVLPAVLADVRHSNPSTNLDTALQRYQPPTQLPRSTNLSALDRRP